MIKLNCFFILFLVLFAQSMNFCGSGDGWRRGTSAYNKQKTKKQSKELGHMLYDSKEFSTQKNKKQSKKQRQKKAANKKTKAANVTTSNLSLLQAEEPILQKCPEVQKIEAPISFRASQELTTLGNEGQNNEDKGSASDDEVVEILMDDRSVKPVIFAPVDGGLWPDLNKPQNDSTEDEASTDEDENEESSDEEEIRPYRSKSNQQNDGPEIKQSYDLTKVAVISTVLFGGTLILGKRFLNKSNTRSKKE